MLVVINLLLMNDEECVVVGICYKCQGLEVVLVFGYKLVQGDLCVSCIQVWLEVCVCYLYGYLCCVCGGQCLYIVQQWLKEVGVDYFLIVGGYKVLCQVVIQVIDELVQCLIVLIGGCIGNGKI